jgi:hypothetical protein
LADEVIDTESDHLFNSRTLSLAQLFQPVHFFIGKGHCDDHHCLLFLSRWKAFLAD